MNSGDKYRHFKGKIVEIVCVAKDSETLDNLVVYKEEDGTIWVRKYEMFVSLVDKQKYPDVKQIYRFEKV